MYARKVAVAALSAMLLIAAVLAVFCLISGTKASALAEMSIYESDFSSVTEQSPLGDGWESGYYKAGSQYLKDGALWIDTKTGSGIATVLYTGLESDDVLIEADMTMLDKTDVNRWMGVVYRSSPKDPAVSMFAAKANNQVLYHAYFGDTTYSGTKGWNVHETKTLGGSFHPELAGLINSGETVRMALAVVNNQVTGFINGTEILRFTAPYTNAHEGGCVGFGTANALVKIDNVQIRSLSELEAEKGAQIDHGIDLPAESGADEIVSAAEPGNYIAEGVLDMTAVTDEAKLGLANNNSVRIEAFVKPSGEAGIRKISDGVESVLISGTATIENNVAVAVKTIVSNGAYRLYVGGQEIGIGYDMEETIARFSLVSGTRAKLTELSMYKTGRTVGRVVVSVDETKEISYGTESPDWSGVCLDFIFSDGTTERQTVDNSMIRGYDPYESGLQMLTLLYSVNGVARELPFSVTVGADPSSLFDLKIGVISDVHIGANAGNTAALTTALQYYKAKGIDVLVGVGDFAHDKIEYLNEFANLIDSVFDDPSTAPEKVFVMGNHDTYSFEAEGYTRGTDAFNEQVETYFTQTLGVVADKGREGLNYYKVIDGYVFVGLYINTPIEERDALLAEAYALSEQNGKPIFVIQHEHPKGSTYISKVADADPAMHEIMKKYPNAVMLAGHSHNPLADERAIWQGEYTVVSCGTLFGAIVEENMYEGGSVNGSFQTNNWSAKSGLYIEIGEGFYDITRYDFANGKKLGKNWEITFTDGDVDRNPYNYEQRAAVAQAPSFAADAQVTAEALSASVVRLTWPGCMTEYPNEDDIVQSYIIRAYDDETDELKAEKRVISQHYLGRVAEKETYTLAFGGLSSQISYRFEIVAVESYQAESKPLTVKADTKQFETTANTATFHADFDYEWDQDCFALYTSAAVYPITFSDGSLLTNSLASSKAILKGLTFKGGVLETMMTMSASGAVLSGGIFLFASDAANEQDTITAYNVHLDSPANSTKLQISLYRFNGKYDGAVATKAIENYFADGAQKDTVRLKAEVTDGVIYVSVNDELLMTQNLGNAELSGAVGLRAHYSGIRFDYFTVNESALGHAETDTEQLDGLFSRAKNLLAEVNIGNASECACTQDVVSQATYDALAELLERYDNERIRAYARHIAEVEELLNVEIGNFSEQIVSGEMHNYGEWNVTKEPTEREKGERQRICGDCQTIDTEEIPMLEPGPEPEPEPEPEPGPEPEPEPEPNGCNSALATGNLLLAGFAGSVAVLCKKRIMRK